MVEMVLGPNRQLGTAPRVSTAAAVATDDAIFLKLAALGVEVLPLQLVLGYPQSGGQHQLEETAMKMAYIMAMVFTLTMGGMSITAAEPGAKRELMDILESIGCKVTSSSKGTVGNVYYAEYTANRRTYHLRACLSEDKSRVWVSCPLAKVSRDDAATNAGALYTLLERTYGIGPRHFKISDGMLYLSGAVENRDVTPHHIRELIEALVADLEKTRGDWDRDWGKRASTASKRVGD
ncbi:MAG: hypothetical protein C0467_29365 [Planctomycetaceae bacterium]|nr:hypothetical protein [Planctomycetaceae bacterium]